MICRKCCFAGRSDDRLVASRVLDRIPVDKTILDDSIQSSLCLGNTAKVRLQAWLCADDRH